MSSRQVVRIDIIINKVKLSWFNIKFPQLTLQENNKTIQYNKYIKNSWKGINLITIMLMCFTGYVDDLKENVVRILEGIETAVLERAAAPRSLSSDFDRPDKQAAVNAFKSRFKN